MLQFTGSPARRLTSFNGSKLMRRNSLVGTFVFVML
jgi:hypothetical protein